MTVIGRLRYLTAGCLVLVGTYACNNNDPMQTTTVAGRVIDGYIAKATVCLDLNRNHRCDADEPSTTTDAAGAYSLSFVGSATNEVVLAEVLDGAQDADDGGKTLGEIGRTGFTLAAPATNASVISPLTTMVTLDLLTHIDAPITDAAIAASVRNVQTALHNADPIMGSDYVKSGNTNLHQLATVITAALPEASMMADTRLRPLASRTVTDSRLLQQTVYKGIRDGVYASLAFVIDFSSGNALKYTLPSAEINVARTIDFMGVTGTGTSATLVFVMPDRAGYLNNLTFQDSVCPAGLSDAECFTRQEFVKP